MGWFDLTWIGLWWAIGDSFAGIVSNGMMEVADGTVKTSRLLGTFNVRRLLSHRCATRMCVRIARVEGVAIDKSPLQSPAGGVRGFGQNSLADMP